MAAISTLTPGFAAMLTSFRRAMKADGKADSTITGRIDAAVRLASWCARTRDRDSWRTITKEDLQLYMGFFLDDARKCRCPYPDRHAALECPTGKPYERGYVNNQYREIQAFWKWYCAEEDAPNPLLGMSPPSLVDKVVPVIQDDKLKELIQGAEKGKDFLSRRDAGILRFYACTGLRLDEGANVPVDGVNLDLLEALVTGKGRKQRIVKIDAKCVKAIDRYIRARAERKDADKCPWLWMSAKGGRLTAGGIRQMIERRGEAIGLAVYPHMFRHTFTHRWLDAGGAEGDLMELNGWESPQMLRRYGKSARSARARRAYDRVNVMGDI